jgi:hypothetical protein
MAQFLPDRKNMIGASPANKWRNSFVEGQAKPGTRKPGENQGRNPSATPDANQGRHVIPGFCESRLRASPNV